MEVASAGIVFVDVERKAVCAQSLECDPDEFDKHFADEAFACGDDNHAQSSITCEVSAKRRRMA
ncbi:MAG TPA: hypothetical protein VKR52_19035 [Terracidiphilus sp.]|nr:hypothetical protein [Terracidiphilus sp.]